MGAPADIDGVVKAVRDKVGAGMGFASLAECGNGADLSRQPATFMAYAVGRPEVHEFQPAVRDTTTILPVSLFYVKQKTGGAEALSSVRQALVTAENTVKGFRAWTPAVTGLVRVESQGSGVGDQDTYGELFYHKDGANYVAGHVALRLMVIS